MLNSSERPEHWETILDKGENIFEMNKGFRT